MNLPPADIACLQARVGSHSVTSEAGMLCVVLPQYELPLGFDVKAADLLLRLSPGYPDVPPDMWWFTPSVKLADGRPIQATDVVESHLGRSWQRWSRHLQPGQWKSGIDCLESFLALIRSELERCVRGA
jgi:hypothetical protein